MLLPGMAVHLVSRGELRAADGAVDAVCRLLSDGQVDVFRGCVFALCVLIKLLAVGKDYSACLADVCIAGHIGCAPFGLLKSFRVYKQGSQSMYREVQRRILIVVGGEGRMWRVRRLSRLMEGWVCGA